MEYLTDKMKAERPEPGGWTEMQQNIYATVGGSPHLDDQYTVFGEVEEGLDVVEKIQNMPTGPGDRPLENIEMKMTIIEWQEFSHCIIADTDWLGPLNVPLLVKKLIIIDLKFGGFLLIL